MKRSKWSAAVMMLSLIVVCFISAPVFPGDDHPWDADGGQNNNPNPGNDSDTTDVPDGDDPSVEGGGDLNPGEGFVDWLLRVSGELAAQLFADSPTASGDAADMSQAQGTERADR